MKPEDEFIYLFVHLAKHYRDGGAGCRYVLDLWLFLRKYPELDAAYIRRELTMLRVAEFYNNILRLMDSWFNGGEVFRSGCCYKRGLGKIFYFRPGHEEYPTFYREDITQVLKNAIEWAKPLNGPVPTLGHFEALENVKDKFEGQDESLKKHTYIK